MYQSSQYFFFTRVIQVMQVARILNSANVIDVIVQICIFRSSIGPMLCTLAMNYIILGGMLVLVAMTIPIGLETV